jgi:hypothetical protein
MHRRAEAERTFGEDLPEHGKLEQYLAVVFRDVAGGLQAVVDHLDAALAPLFPGPFQNASDKVVADSSVHT